MPLIDYYLIASTVLLILFGLLFSIHNVAPIWTILVKVVINLTALLGVALALVRWGVIGA